MRIDASSTLAQTASTKFDGVVRAVQAACRIVPEISAAADGKSKSIAQVNSAGTSKRLAHSR